MNGQTWRDRTGGRRRGMRGAAIIFVTVAIVTCLAFSVLAIDVGLVLLARIQLQNAADAGALAGAMGLITGGQTEARDRAIAVTGLNVAYLDEMDPVVITEPDVTFPEDRRVRVRTHRTRETGDALNTFFIRVLDPAHDRLGEASAIAEAEWFFICGVTCLKPFVPPDRWGDLDGDGEYDYAEPFDDTNGNGTWDPGEPYTDENGNGIWDPDEPYDHGATGYMPPADVGTRITLKWGNPNNDNQPVTEGFYFAVNLPPLNDPQGNPEPGADQYRWNIANCSPYTVEVGDSLQVEPGNMVGPTRQGCQVLIDADPGAYWNDASQSVEGSAYGTSPRVINIAFFDPRYTPRSGRTFVIVAKLGAFFLEGVHGNGQVRGVYMGHTTQGEPCESDEPGFLTGVRLVL